jgi:hypothetical protein
VEKGKNESNFWISPNLPKWKLVFVRLYLLILVPFCDVLLHYKRLDTDSDKHRQVPPVKENQARNFPVPASVIL